MYIQHHISKLLVGTILFCTITGCTDGRLDTNTEPESLPRAVLAPEAQAQAEYYFQRASHHTSQYAIGVAIAYLDSTLQVDSTHYPAYFQKGLLLRRLNDYEASSSAYRQALLYNRELLDAWYNLANNAFWQNQFIDAVHLYDTLLTKQEAPSFLHNKGRAHLALGEDSLAQQSFLRAVLLDSTYAYGHASLGTQAEMNGEYEDMFLHYRAAVKHEPLSDEYWYKLGMSHMRKGEEAGALQAWDTALEINPFHFGALFNKGKVWHQQGREGAEGLLEKAESIRAADAEIQRFKRSSERFPEDAYYRHALGNLYVQRKQWDLAAREFKIAIALAPTDIKSMINLGNVYVTQGLSDQAVVVYEQALKIEPASLDVMRNLAIVYMRSGQREAALEQWRAILAIDPSNDLATRAVRQFTIQ